MGTLTVQTVSGPVEATCLVPGETLNGTLTGVWRAHVEAHLDRCGRVTGPLSEWVCREGHSLWSDRPQ